MGVFDWLRHTASQVSRAIKLIGREDITLHPDIALPPEAYPATVEELEEIVARQVQAGRFIRTELPEEAIRLARGVKSQVKLTNVWQIRQWTGQNILEIQPRSGQYLSVRGVFIGPDGKMSFVDVRFPEGQGFDWDEFYRRAASALEDDFIANYEGAQYDRTGFVKKFLAHVEPYIEHFKSIV